jgi:FkbM family methyltransferase
MYSISKAVELPKRMSRYVHRYGGWAGSYVFMRIVLGHGRAWLPLPRSSGRILLRRHTSDVAAFEQVFIEGEYDFKFQAGSPKYILDGGANIGCASVFFAQKFPQATVLAIEPERSNFAILQDNAGRFTNINAIRAAVWNSEGEVEIENPRADNWAFRVQQRTAESLSAVPALTIPAIMRIAGTDWIDILKLDVEGAEKEIFDETSVQWLDRVGMIIIELHDWLKPGCSDALFTATKRLHWNQFRAGENTVLIRQ